jgi:hypothetical protein
MRLIGLVLALSPALASLAREAVDFLVEVDESGVLYAILCLR